MLHTCCAHCFSIYAGFRNESHLRKEWLAQRKVEKQIHTSEKQKQAFYQVLDRLCDCLIHLGPDFTILGPCRKLAAMLFLPNGKALQGSCFCDCISTREDQDRFVVAMNENTSEEDPAGIMNFHLKDSLNQEVQVHMYYTSFNDQDGSRHHIIGIVEAGAERKVADESAGRDSFHPASFRESDCYSESEASVALESATGSDVGEASVVFRDNDSLNIVSCTAGFTSLCGPIGQDEQLLDWIVNKDQFAGYVQHVRDRFLTIPPFEGPLKLVPAVASRANILYVAESVLLTAVTDSGQVDDLSQSRLTLRITLNGIRDLHRRRKPKARRAASTKHPSQCNQLASL